ncbi:MAG TPA: hypothetical protein VHU18_10240 [Rhizomicrobium sp.]|jgi:hypothetical protein|nr:hypothetical protein [Rhizomicrobium sp.]
MVTPSQPGDSPGESKFSARETALYSKDLLRALKSIAERQRHHRLAELIDAAAAEAERIAEISE